MCAKRLPTPIKVSGYENLINFNVWARFIYVSVCISKVQKAFNKAVERIIYCR